MPFAATWMDLEIFLLSEVSQTEEEKYHMTSIVCGNLKRNETNELIYKTDSENELMVSRREECKGEIVWEIEVDMYTLVYLPWITNKDLL